MLFVSEKVLLFDPKSYRRQECSLTLGTQFTYCVILCLPCTILKSFLRREKTFSQRKLYVILKIIPSSETTIPFHRKWFGHRLNNSLNCLAGLWTFLRLKDVKISLHIIVLIVRGCFDRTHGLNKLFFALDARALLMFNYDKPSRIFPCILLTRNHMIFLVQFGINKHLLIFSKTTNCTCPTGSCNFVST